MIPWEKFLEWAFYGVISGGTLMVVAFLRSIKDSIVELNKSVAIMLEKSEWYEKKLEEHDRKIEILENRVRQRSH